MRVALRQDAQERGEGPKAIKRQRRGQKAGRAQGPGLKGEGAEMLVEAGAPGRLHGVSRLQDRLHRPRAAAVGEPEMAAVRGRHHFEDERRFAVPAGAEDDGFIRPLHDRE